MNRPRIIVILIVIVILGVVAFWVTPQKTTTPTDGEAELAEYNSGIRGEVTLGPQCPVIRDGEPCPDKPYQTIIAVRQSSSDSTFVLVQTDEEGSFDISLPPGEYTLGPQGGNPFPRCPEETIVVESDVYTETTLTCDTGIR